MKLHGIFRYYKNALTEKEILVHLGLSVTILPLSSGKYAVYVGRK